MTGKMQLFVREYLKDFNATQAAIRAGYSKKTAASIGEENLRKPEIAKALDKAKSDILGDKDKIILENILFWEEMRRNPKSKDVDRIRASENLGRYAAMFTEKIEIVDITIGKPPTMDEAEFPE